jgi:hypothetical protein
MASPKIFAATDANIRLTIDTDPLSASYAGFGLADIDDLVVTLTRNNVSKLFKISTGEIAVNGADLIMTIHNNVITDKGTYDVSIRLTDQAAKIRGITSSLETLTFE